MRLIKRIFKIVLYILIITLAFIVVCNIWIIASTESKVYQSVEGLPERKIALVLGTSKRLVDGTPNPFFHHRIKKAAELYKKGKVKHFILSGDNETRYYNEPLDMKKALINLGVPEKAITLDYAGLRTLDSIVRCKEVFGQDEVIIITQKFHIYRALFISQFFQLDALGLEADGVPVGQSIKVVIRELLARPKAIIDLYVLNNASSARKVKKAP